LISARSNPAKKPLLICKSTPSVELDTGDYWLLAAFIAGISSPAASHVNDITVVTKLDANYRDATLLADVQIAGNPQTRGRLFTAEARRWMCHDRHDWHDRCDNASLGASCLVAEIVVAEKPHCYRS
jgi:hypothetical protein